MKPDFSKELGIKKDPDEYLRFQTTMVMVPLRFLSILYMYVTGVAMGDPEGARYHLLGYDEGELSDLASYLYSEADKYITTALEKEEELNA